MFSARRILLVLALLVAIYTSEVLGKEASSGKPGATESILSVYVRVPPSIRSSSSASRYEC